jgi:ABC-type antimicrobial peptide transport system permease subunit
MVLSSIALALSVSGIFGVVTYALSRRTREIGIRTALGATPGGIVRLVMRQSSRLVVVGAAAGLLISFTVLAALRAMVTLPGLRLLDPVAFIASVAIVAAAAIVAAFVPARRAGRVDPVRALRADG